MTDAELSFLTPNITDVLEMQKSKMTATEKCQMVSELDPTFWNEEVLWCNGKNPPVFGEQQTAMGRDFTVTLLEALMWTNLCDSLGNARKAVRNNGVRINRKVVSDINKILTKSDALPNVDAIVLEFGKFNFGVIELC